MRTITRKKAIAAIPATYDGSGRQNQDAAPRAALWTVYADGEEIGEYRDKMFSPTKIGRANGERYSQYGTWAKVKAALASK